MEEAEELNLTEEPGGKPVEELPPAESAEPEAEAAPEPGEAEAAQPSEAVAAGEPSKMNWYIIHTYSGFEQKVKNAILERAKSRGIEHLVPEVLVPTETVEEMVKGQRRLTHRKFYPGYVLVHMELTDETWHLVKDTPKVSGFIGSKEEPAPIPEEDAQKIISQMQEGVLKPKPKIKF